MDGENPAVTSPTGDERVDDAVAALALKLTPEEMTALEEPYAPHPVMGFS